ncbi:MAG: tRNA preQ1(34) S-adenosylmethionine ribosyltransferase-isomerase QueA [Gammaproteobacteria bacterium]|nr:tRNA preQ1(34) S-adenosylmethionine ribosyltransferase-isomerase QueA [Gammaproteobacteria bacterium]
MDLNQFDYVLPAGLIAQYPLPKRTASRLLSVSPLDDGLVEWSFDQLEKLCSPGDLLVVNNTRVIPARLFARKPTGGKVEVMLERVIDEFRALVMLGANKPIRIGQVLLLNDDTAKVVGRQGQFFILLFSRSAELIFQNQGVMPIPPYIKRESGRKDEERYQTVYSQKLGAVAAPTAGLHFDQQLIDRLVDRGINWASVTLHVGAGTFQPVKVEDVHKHVMHKEYVEVDSTVCDAIQQTKNNGRNVIAIGTTVVRALESAALYFDQEDPSTKASSLGAYVGDTDLFIYPGFEFRVVDALLTNFHLPKSTLLMMVSAFAGYEKVMAAYRFAISRNFRFFSYGDAMYLQRSQ